MNEMNARELRVDRFGTGASRICWFEWRPPVSARVPIHPGQTRYPPQFGEVPLRQTVALRGSSGDACRQASVSVSFFNSDWSPFLLHGAPFHAVISQSS